MGIVELLLIAVGLSMDAFAVSICRGLGMRRLNLRTAAVLALFFGGFQRLLEGHDPQLLALAVDQPDFLFPDFLVDLMFHDANVKAPP